MTEPKSKMTEFRAQTMAREAARHESEELLDAKVAMIVAKIEFLEIRAQSTDSGNQFVMFLEAFTEFKKLKETRGIVDYHSKFQVISSRIDLPELYLVRKYLAGLNAETQRNVRMFNPQTVRQCFAIADLYEWTHPSRSSDSVVVASLAEDELEATDEDDKPELNSFGTERIKTHKLPVKASWKVEDAIEVNDGSDRVASECEKLAPLGKSDLGLWGDMKATEDIEDPILEESASVLTSGIPDSYSFTASESPEHILVKSVVVDVIAKPGEDLDNKSIRVESKSSLEVKEIRRIVTRSNSPWGPALKWCWVLLISIEANRPPAKPPEDFTIDTVKSAKAWSSIGSEQVDVKIIPNLNGNSDANTAIRIASGAGVMSRGNVSDPCVVLQLDAQVVKSDAMKPLVEKGEATNDEAVPLSMSIVTEVMDAYIVVSFANAGGSRVRVVEGRGSEIVAGDSSIDRTFFCDDELGRVKFGEVKNNLGLELQFLCCCYIAVWAPTISCFLYFVYDRGRIWGELVSNGGFETGSSNTIEDSQPWSFIGTDSSLIVSSDRSSHFTCNRISLRMEVLCNSQGPNTGGVGIYNHGFWNELIEDMEFDDSNIHNVLPILPFESTFAVDSHQIKSCATQRILLTILGDLTTMSLFLTSLTLCLSSVSRFAVKNLLLFWVVKSLTGREGQLPRSLWVHLCSSSASKMIHFIFMAAVMLAYMFEERMDEVALIQTSSGFERKATTLNWARKLKQIDLFILGFSVLQASGSYYSICRRKFLSLNLEVKVFHGGGDLLQHLSS